MVALIRDRDPRLVLLERDDQARELYTEYLVGEGWRVRAEALFDDAIAALKKGGVPLIIAGIAPGGATVAQIAAAVRRNSPHTALLALLGREASEGTLRAVRDGALEALAKPVTPQALALAVRRCLETAGMLERHPEMRRHIFVYNAARRLQRAGDHGALAETLLDACIATFGGEGGVIFRPGGAGGGQDVLAARQLEESAAAELAAGLDWPALAQAPGVVVPVPAAPATPVSAGRGRARTLAQLSLVRVGAPGAERLWVGLLHGAKSAQALAATPEAERRAAESELALFAAEASFALEMLERYPDGGEPQIDPLTDLADARSLERALSHELALARKAERGVATLWVEVAGLPEVRQAQGELAADRALVEAARLLSRSVRDVDLVARTGDTAFGVLLAAAAPGGAQRAADRIRGAFAAHRFLAREGLDLSLGGAVGVATWPDSGTDGHAGALLEAARAAAAQAPRPASRRRAKG